MPIRHRSVVLSLIISLFFAALPMRVAQADMIDTSSALHWRNAGDMRAQVGDLLARDEVRAALQERGVKPEAVAARVAALSDDEARAMARQIDQLPAGGDGIIGVLFAVFIILLITDILGLTKVFPFTRSISHH